MTRRLPFRFLSALVGVWLAVVLAEPAALHVCPAHDEAAGGHATHVHDAGSEQQTAPQQCSCLGHCAGASLTGLPEATTAGAAPAWIIASAQPVAESDVLATPTPHLLPWANGPPRLS